MMARCAAAASAAAAAPVPLLPQRVAAWRARLSQAASSSPSPPPSSASPRAPRRAAATTTPNTTTTTSTPFPHPITYHPDFTINPIPDGHRFPMPKDALLHARLRAAGAERVFQPEPADRDDLLLCHTPSYVDGFLNGTLTQKEMRRIGLPWSQDLVRRTLVGVGSAVLAARLATQLGLAITTNGGTHHAHPAYGSGFCIFNDLAVAARKAQRDGLARACFFVDLDVHQGDGTAEIFAHDKSVYTLSLHCAEQAFPEPFPGDMDVGLSAGTGDEIYLAALAEALPRAWREFEQTLEVDDDDAHPPHILALYNAGVDVHKDDDLGKLALTDAGIAARDRFVLDFFASRGVPLCAAIGGGYNLKDHGSIVERHVHLHAAAGEMFGRFAEAADERRRAAAEAKRRQRATTAAAGAM